MTMKYTVKIRDGYSHSGFISWSRLISVLRQSGEIRDNELLCAFKCDKQGIQLDLQVTSDQPTPE